MSKFRSISALLLAAALVCLSVNPVKAGPPNLPSSFNGTVRVLETPLSVSDVIEAYVPGVASPVSAVHLQDNGGLVYSINVSADSTDTPAKDGGLEGDLITFKINGRVVMTAIWHGGTSVPRDIHPPQAIPGASYSGNEGASISFSGSANDALTTDTFTYQWDWNNDGTYDETGQTPTHSWPDNTSATVALKVTDSQGGEGTATVVVTVNNVAPTLTLSGASTTNEGATYTLNMSASDPGADTISGWTITWGDGAVENVTGNPSSATHVFADGPNSYTVSATATDEDGTYNAGNTVAVTVNNVPPTATWNAPTSVSEGSSFNLSLTSPSDPGSADTTAGFTYAFDCGGGSYSQLSTTSTTSCSTTDNGTLAVKGKIHDKDGGETEYTASVTVNNVNPTATWNHPTSVNEGTSFNLSLTSPSDPGSADTTAGFTYAFDCGSGSYSQLSATNTTSCSTTDNGTLAVKGKIHDKDGGETEYTASVTVDDVPPIADAGGPYAGTAGQPVALTASATCVSVDNCTYEWDLNNNGTFGETGETGLSVSATWNNISSYTVSFRATDNDGNSTTDTATVNIAGAHQTTSLAAGWNLVSFNLIPQSTNIAQVLSSITGTYTLVYAWDASVASNNWIHYDPTQGFGNSLTSLDLTRGFWINMSHAATLDVVGSVPSATDITFHTAAPSGWNLVGYPALTNRTLPEAMQITGVSTDYYTLIYAYHAGDTTDPWKLYDRVGPTWANDLTVMSQGWGYWVKVSTAQTWRVAYP